jgi:tetratricopeptide (TPR) repeat protein
VDRKTGLFILSLAAMVAVVYWQVGKYPFIANLDDGTYVVRNDRIHQGLTFEAVRWSLTSFEAGNWHPLTWISHMADVELFGMDAGRHHLVNVLFHAANSILLFLVLRGATGEPWPSWVVGALFAVHPLHVESVAWISERKDVLCAFFWLLSMSAYVRYTARGGTGSYLSAAGLFALALTAKPMAVTLPFVFLLLDWWPLCRFPDKFYAQTFRADRSPSFSLSRLIAEKIPFFALSAASCTVTFFAQSEGGAVASLGVIGPGLRLANAVVSYAKYLGKTAWPASLAVFYPYPEEGVSASMILFAAVPLLGISAATVLQAKRRPWFFAGWSWFLGTLVPVIGLLQVGQQAMADRYMYLPSVGLFVAAAWGIPELTARSPFRRQALAGLIGIALVSFGGLSRLQAGYWNNSVDLFTHSIKVTGNNWFLWNNLGITYEDQGRHKEAIESYREALRLSPDFVEAWYNLGVAVSKINDRAMEADAYRNVLRIKPDHPEAWNNLGVVYSETGDLAKAAEAFRNAVRFKPDYPEALKNLGITYRRMGIGSAKHGILPGSSK